MVALTRWRPLSRLLVSATEKRGRGLYAGFLCRKRYIDDQLTAAIADGIEAVVILGAGFDTRAYRFPALTRLPVFEIDLPENIAAKKALLRKVYGRVPDHVRLVGADFDTENLAEVLGANGFPAHARTFFSWEAVTRYLTEDGVRRAFDFLATAARPDHLRNRTHRRRQKTSERAFRHSPRRARGMTEELSID